MIEKKLSNGITLAAQPVPGSRSVSTGIWTSAGSVTETPELNGVSHLIEHMLFKGTRRRSARRIAEDVDRIGGIINAFTSKEATCYYIQVMDEKLPEGVDILSDLFCDAVLDDEELQREKGVVLEEIAMSNDQPDDVVMDLAASVFFRGCSLEKTILGPPENIESFARADLVGYMDRFYTADNVVVAVAGNFDEARLTDLLEEGLAGVRPRRGDLPDFAALESRPYEPGFALQKKDIEQVNLCFALPCDSYADERRRNAMRVVSNILGGSMSSRLFQKIREERGLAYSVFSHAQFFRDAGMFYVFSATKPENVVEVSDLIREELDRLRSEGISKDELEQSKAMLKGHLVMSLENSSSRMNTLARNLLQGGRLLSEDEMIANIESVTGEEARREIDRVVRPELLSRAFVGSAEDAERLRSAG